MQNVGLLKLTARNNIRQAIEEGIPDVKWAYDRMQTLLNEQRKLSASINTKQDTPPKISIDTALSYRKNLDMVLVSGSRQKRRSL